MRVLLVLSLLAACSSPPVVQSCKVPQESRCHRDVVELCAPNGQWMTVLRCRDMGVKWICIPTAEGPACLNTGK